MVVVNLTTTFQRLCLCRIALTSLALQSRLPDQINLWVSREPYMRDLGISTDGPIHALLASLPIEAKRLINIKWVPNTGPYRKLIPMLREARATDIIITADDDIFYGDDWLAGLLKTYEQTEGRLVAARVRLKKRTLFGNSSSYLHWKLLYHPQIVRDDYVVTFGGGAVLNREMFRQKDIEDDAYLKIAASADDLWYSKLLTLNGNDVVVVPELQKSLYFIQHSDGLTNQNYPRAVRFVEKVRLQVWDKVLGAFGVPVCGNDRAYKEIDNYFRGEQLLPLGTPRPRNQ